MEAGGLENTEPEELVKKTIHNMIETVSVKTSSAARYGLYQDDAEDDGMEDCAELFSRLARQEHEAVGDLLNCLRAHLEEKRA